MICMPVKPIIFQDLDPRQLLSDKLATSRLSGKIPGRSRFGINDLAGVGFFQEFKFLAIYSSLKRSDRLSISVEKNNDLLSAKDIEHWVLLFDHGKGIC